MGKGERRWAAALAIASAVLAIAIAARLSWTIPGSAVPITMQTLAVVLSGAWLGSKRGALATGLYGMVGALGLPVFSEGAAGLAVLLGPTGGYLLGFVPAAALVGWAADRRWFGRWWLCPLAMLAAQGIILAIGALRLSMLTGALVALQTGVVPFLLGAAVKSGLGAAMVALTSRRARPDRNPVASRKTS